MAAIVFLRLCVGWHFFSEGVEKVSYDRDNKEWNLEFSAEGFFRQAKGPLSQLCQGRFPGEHRWQDHLAVAEEMNSSSNERLSAWAEAYVKRRQSELAKGLHPEAEIPDHVSFAAWLNRIDRDRRKTLKRFTDITQLSEQQRQQAAKVYERRRSQLVDYLVGESLDIQAYRHELWRLKILEQSPGADEVPFLVNRTSQKNAEISRSPLAWIATIRQFDDDFSAELMAVLTDEQTSSSVGKQATQALTEPHERQLHLINMAVTGLTIGVGVCLLCGLFTRLAAQLGAMFLLAVMATQPPWIADANLTFFFYQLVEFAALLFLAAVNAGRWAGLDFFLHALWSKCFGTKGK